MILLDTNYLIRALVDGTEEGVQISNWLDEGEELCTSAIAWYEFLSGPVDEDGVDLIRDLLQSRVLPFAADTAAEAARLFNAAGRMRRLRVDAMIAASAIISGTHLATENEADFAVFTGDGLKLK